MHRTADQVSVGFYCKLNVPKQRVAKNLLSNIYTVKTSVKSVTPNTSKLN